MRRCSWRPVGRKQRDRGIERELRGRDMDATVLWVVVFLCCIASCLAWGLICARMREKRAKMVASLDALTEYHAINVHTLYVEFPFLSRKALEFALFRTYAIPSISALLRKGGQFATAASKRYDDTDLLVQEMLFHHVDGDRGSLALRRLNLIHSLYPIANDDYLYVLSMLALLPIEWAATYGYREWTEQEELAYYRAWHDIGVRMGIKGIPGSIQACRKLRDQYEAKHMVYADSNKEIAESTLRLLLSTTPAFLWPLARKIIYSLMDDRQLRAFRYPRQPPWLVSLSRLLLKSHGWVVRCMLPPRPLHRMQGRIVPGCPVSQVVSSLPEGPHPVVFHVYGPPTYEKGYMIPNLGVVRLGHLGKPHDGPLLCPLEQCGNLAWPLPFSHRTLRASLTN